MSTLNKVIVIIIYLFPHPTMRFQENISARGY